PRPTSTLFPYTTLFRSHLKPLGFAYVGRLVSEKGLPVLVQAARRLLDQGQIFHLKLVGDGPERKRLESDVTALGLQQHVTFTGLDRKSTRLNSSHRTIS